MDFGKKRILIFIVAVLAVSLTANYLGRSPREYGNNVKSFPPVIGAWQGSEVPCDRALLTSWLGTDHLVFREYRNRDSGHEVTLYIAYYPDMEASDKVHEPEVCYPGQGWSITSNEILDIVIAGNKMRIKRMYIKKGTRLEVVYSWWQTRNSIIAENSWYRLWQVMNRLLHRDTSSLWVRISSEYSGDGPQLFSAEKVIRAFYSDVSVQIGRYFPPHD